MPLRPRWNNLLHTAALVFFFGATLFAFPLQGLAADLTLSPASSTASVGDTFTIKVMIDPGTDSVNAADGQVTYDKDLLSLESFSKDGSVFSLWTSEPSADKSAGTLDFSGGTPSAFSTAGMVLSIKFKALKEGTANVSFTKGSVLAADGKGTDVYQEGHPASVEIAAAKPPPPPPPAPPPDTTDGTDQTDGGDAVDTGPPPPAPVIDSPTFPKAENWYATSTGLFTWNLLPDVTGVRVLLSPTDNVTPTQELKGAATSTLVTGIKDGTSYFFAQFKNASGWGDVAKRVVQIDTVPPKAFDVTLQPAASKDDTPKLAFKAQDDLSGVDHYQLLLGSTSVATIAAKDMGDGTYPVPPQDGGAQLVIVRAYDMAGNMTEASKTLDLPKVAKPSKDGTTAAPAAPQSFWSIERILLILFAFAIGGLITWMRMTKKDIEQKRAAILQRVAEAREKNDRVFSAMREEFEALINNFDKKPQLTPEERQLLEEIKEVLDISEEVIDSGMDELKKAVRGESA